VYANLDVIGDAEATLKNQRLMEKAGLKPLPTYHFGEDIKYLKMYIKDYDYVALGGVAIKRTKASLVSWLDQCFDLICDPVTRLPKIKVHGFGITAVDIMLRYPWYSVDSTAWVQTSRMGTIYVPRRTLKGDDYLRTPLMVCVSFKNPDKGTAGSKHFDILTPEEKVQTLDYIRRQGFKMGKSEWKVEKVEKDEEKEESIIEKGLCNDYRQRDEFNAKYFLNLEKALTDRGVTPFGKAQGLNKLL